jgi:glutamate synthase (NADPH/NADH) small chain
MEAEGIVFRTGVSVGDDFTAAELRDQFDAICLTGGATVPRDLPVPGRELDGVHFAMEYLAQSNRRNAGQDIADGKNILADGKQVVILGGGDTGADCLGTAHRQEAERIWQLELLSEPPIGRTATNAWPDWPLIMRTSSAHEEGGERDFDIMTKAFEGENGRVQRLRAVRLRWENDPQSGRPQPVELPGTEFTIDTDLVLLALGFVHGNANSLLGDLGVELDARGNAATDASMMTNVDGVFAGGDMQSGQSLVVRAIASGRDTARGCDAWLNGGVSQLPAVHAYVRHPLPIVLT